MKTEIIASWKLVTKEGRELYIINTISGATVWVSKNQFDTNAEQISYKTMKAGEKYIKKDKTEGVLIADRNEFLGCGKQVVKKYDTLEIMDHLAAKGVTPSFNLS